MPIASLQRGKTLSTSVLDMALSHLMVRLLYWSFGKSGVPLCCHYSLINSELEW